jgi:hypothetical protein
MTRSRRKPSTLPIGTISEGTLIPEDLIPAYISVLEDLRLSREERKTLNAVRRDWNNAECNQDGPGTFDDDDLPNLLEDLIILLESHVPDYAYFGSLEGDGACFGIWPSIDQLEEDSIERRRYLDPNDSRGHDASVLKLDAGDPFPKAKLGSRDSYGRGFSHVMEVSDHGNVTLYRRASNRWIEVWSVV